MEKDRNWQKRYDFDIEKLLGSCRNFRFAEQPFSGGIIVSSNDFSSVSGAQPTDFVSQDSPSIPDDGFNPYIFQNNSPYPSLESFLIGPATPSTTRLTRSVPDAHFTKLALSALNQVRTAMVGAPDGQDTTRVPPISTLSNRTRKIGVETNPVFASSDISFFLTHLTALKPFIFLFVFLFVFLSGEGSFLSDKGFHNFSLSLFLSLFRDIFTRKMNTFRNTALRSLIIRY